MNGGPAFEFGRDAFGDGGWEESVDKLVGRIGDLTSWPRHGSKEENRRVMESSRPFVNRQECRPGRSRTT